MRSLKLTLAYDGTDFSGWQVQPGRRTVQGTLEQALRRITGQPVRVVASGRTDAGVHALGQVVSCAIDTRLDREQLLRALNANLPPDLRMLRVESVPDRFHAIGDAVRKRYRYVIQDGPIADLFRRRYCWFLPGRLDHQAMHRAAQPLVGRHDYASFQASGAERATTVRTVFELAVARTDPPGHDLVVVEIEADGFLYNMVRNIVGTLVDVGRGARAETWPAQVLAARDRRQAGRTAPARGLFLLRVDYAARMPRPTQDREPDRSFPPSPHGLD
jgi:tRNA pseudouridine38-40 synthase